MKGTALQLSGGLGGTRVGEYRGAMTAAIYSDRKREWAALRTGCGVYDLGYRARISLTGADRARWLNGMVTNNIRDLAVGNGIYAFLLNPQGHILGDLYAYNLGDSITVDTDRSQLEKILATFDHFIIMDDVGVANLSGQVTALGMAGPKAREVMERAGLGVPELQPLQLHTIECECDCGCLTCTIVRTDNPVSESYELWLAAEHVKSLWDTLIVAGAAPVGFEAAETQRIVAGIPRYGVDIRERDLPQETAQTRALNFSKGCYVGQEIVERIRSRGAVHRTFAGFLMEGAEKIAPGTKIQTNGKEVGEVTSAASLSLASQNLDGTEKTIALGYIRREIGVPGREVTIGGVKAIVVTLPVTNVASVQEAAVETHRA
jgi:folate-binding protein YgfZ